VTIGKSKKIKSSYVRFGRRTYFFDINQINEKKYLKITEAKFMGEGKDRVYNSFLLFTDNIESFQKNLSEVAGYLN